MKKMQCDDVRNHFSEYIDGECSAELTAAIKAHVAECAKCRADLTEYRSFVQAFCALPQEDLPVDFSLNLQERITKEKSNRSTVKPLYSRTWTRVLSVCACLVLLIGLLSLGVGVAKRSNYDNTIAESSNKHPYSMMSGMIDDSLLDKQTIEMPMEENINEDKAGESDSVSDNAYDNNANLERKIIMNWNLTIQVDDFDDVYEQIKCLADRYGGYVVSGNVYTNSDSTRRDGNISIRVASDRVNDAVSEIGTFGTIEDNNFFSNDVTTEYYDIQSRLTQYSTQEERLLDLYEKANTVDELISIENELTRVRSELDSLEGAIQYYNQLTTMSLIDIYIYTPSTYTQSIEPQGWDGFFKRLGEGFLNGINSVLDFLANFLVILISILPALIIIAAVIIAIVLWVRHRRRKKRSMHNGQ